MKIQRIFERKFFALGLISLIIISCNKENSGSSVSSSSSSTIAVAASLDASVGSTADSIYILQPCPRGFIRDSIASSALPANVSSYLTSNYAGYIFDKSFSIVNSASSVAGYVVIIYYNDNPVGILFNSSGEFVRTLEQREKGDLDGKGWHHGGRFEERGGFMKDTIAITALPTNLLSYFSSNYAGDTLVKAFQNRDGGYLIISRNNGLFATSFDASGNFVKRIQLPTKEGSCSGIEQSALPAVTLAYLDQAYPDYVFKKAFLITLNGKIQAYVVVIDANNIKYALEFDSSGNFLKAKTIS
jgi:hypothetical protein